MMTKTQSLTAKIKELRHFCIAMIFSLPFAISGDTGEGEEATEGEMIRESDNTFMIWASGRHNCLGVAIQIDVSLSLLLYLSRI